MRRHILLLLFLCSLWPLLPAQTYLQWSEKALELIAADSLRQAEDALLQALKLDPTNAKNALLLSNLGWVQRRLGQHEKALESYSLAVNLAPRAQSVLLDRAALSLEMGLADRAYADYCRVLDDDRQNKEALLMRAYIYVTRRDYAAARIDYNRLLEAEPTHYGGRMGLATLEQKEGRLQEALALLSAMLADHPADATLYIARADVEREMKQEELALVDLAEAIRLDASSSEAYLLRGYIYLAQKKKVLARADFERAISLGIPPADVREALRLCK